MSFWTDLQAWTQAQFDALMLANAKRKRKWTAEDINRLLRDRINKRMKAKQGRAIGPEFLRTGGRIIPEYILPIGLVEHGWLTGSAGAWIIYTWIQLASYLTGQGITIGSSGQYTSTITGRVTPTALADDPERYSGLMRLLVQSLVGAGRHVVDIMPLAAPPYDGQPYWSYLYDLPQIGLMRGPDKSYWLIKQVLSVGDAGCGIYAVKLTFPSTIDWLITLADSGTLSPAMQLYADSWILSQAIKPTTATIKILSRDDFIVSGGFLGDGFSGKLVFRQQHRKASDELSAGGSGVSLRSIVVDAVYGTWIASRQMYCRHGTLNITWTSNVPSASISINDQGYSLEWAQSNDLDNDPDNFGEGSIISIGRTSTVRLNYLNNIGTYPELTETGEKVYACWWGEDGVEYKAIHIDSDEPPGDVTSDSGGATTLNLGNVSLTEPYPTLAPVHKWSTYSAVQQLYGWEVAGQEMSTVFHDISDITEDVDVEVLAYNDGQRDGWKYEITYDLVVRATTYTWYDERWRSEIHLVMGPPGLAWLVRRGYTRTVTVKTYQKLTTAYYMGGEWPPEDPKNFSLFVCPILTYSADPTLVSTVVESEEVTPPSGWVFNGATKTAMSEADVNAMCDLVDTMAGTPYYSSTRLDCYPGYGGRVNIEYLALSAGLDADGAALAGRWIGAA